MATVADLLQWSQKYFPPILVAPEVFARHTQLTTQFPISMAWQLGFECYLHDPAGAAGFAMNTLHNSPGWKLLCGTFPYAALPNNLVEQPFWSSLRTLCLRVDDPADKLYHRLHSLWLEFDVDTDVVASQADLFISFGDAAPEADHLLAVLDTLHQPVILHALLTCLKAMPANSQVRQMGMMVGRGLPGVRLVMQFDDPGAIPVYLAAIGWRGELPQIEQPFRTLQIDVLDRVIPRISLEPELSVLRKGDNPHLWQHWLDTLVEQGMCLPDKREALLALPGAVYSGIGTALLRGLSHSKLVLHPDHLPQAKVYFGVRQVELPENRRNG